MLMSKISSKQSKIARALHGKTIASVHLCDVGERNGDTKVSASEPIFVFTDGTTLRVDVTETDAGSEYGVDLIYPGRAYNPGSGL